MYSVAPYLVGRVGGRTARQHQHTNRLSDFEQSVSPYKNIIEMDTTKRAGKSDAAILHVNRMYLNTSRNGLDHHTSEFDIVYFNEKPVIRRGQQFEVTIDFNRPYDKEKDDLRLVFQFGSNPYPGKGTHAEFMLSDPDKVGEWGGWVKSSSGNSLTLILTSSCKAPVGKWNMNIDVVQKKKEGGVDVLRYRHTDPIYILFNPWCRHDTVYLHDNDLCAEYVLNDKGIIYIGTANNISGRDWAFGQFEEDVLDCVLYLLDNNMIDRNRGDPVLVTRKLSSLVNSNDNNGILVGNWSGEYDDGTSPTQWTGSEAILTQYYKTKQPVRYGQCWVFSGIVTTVCRALGIPARSITNFCSAHDTDGSTTIDKHIDERYEEIHDMNADSDWNFHVWNDVWMARPLLPTGYGGWQAIDATPQETSDGIFACGPMSLQAIRRGEVNHMYDGPFIFSEVNGDIVMWMMKQDGSRILWNSDSKYIGKHISTKKPHSDEREDITNIYKFAEGSAEERTAVLKAKQYVSEDELDSKPTVNMDVEFTVEFNHDTRLGDDAFVQLKIKNTSDETRTISGTMAISSMYYTGVHFKNIKKEKLESKMIAPQTETCLDLKVTADEYMPKLAEHAICKVNTIFFVKETSQVFAKITELRLQKPTLTIKAPGSVKRGDKLTIEVSFNNPLNVTLTNSELAVEGPGLQRRKTIKQSNVAANATFATSVDLTPAKKGKREVIVMFNCAQVYAVTGKHKVEVFE